MRRVSSVILGIFAIVFLTALPNAQAPSPTAAARLPAVTFARDIQPILEKSCASCHSGDLKLADLDLSNREAAMRGGEHGRGHRGRQLREEQAVSHGGRPGPAGRCRWKAMR